MTLPGDLDPRNDWQASGEVLGHDPRPSIALRGSGLPTPLLMALVAVLAIALFLLLDTHRRARLDVMDGRFGSPTALPPSPPPLVIPPPPALAPVIIHETPPAPAIPAPLPPVMLEMPRQTFTPAPPRAEPTGSSGPALVIDLTPGSGAIVNGAEGGGGAAMADDTVRATLIRNRASVIPQGTIMAAVLETPLDSDRPGLARAVVSHDARSFDGTRVLIPRGSRLIGEFKADNTPGLRRILITWTRLIRPDGVAIRIASPVSDTMGGAGVPGSVNTHFFARFAGAVLQSALAVGVNLASQQASTSNNTLYLGLPSQATPQLGQLVPDANRPPTVKVREGAEIAVIVAHDLDFSGTPAVR
jgi:type IV secretion system protein VirB10